MSPTSSGAGLPLTEEQAGAVESFWSSRRTKVTALAGTGKTTTLVACSQRLSEVHGLYVTYSRALRDEMSARIARDGLNMRASTAHSLAWAQTPRAFRDRATDRHGMKMSQVAKHLGMNGTVRISDSFRLTPARQAMEARRVVTAMRLEGERTPSEATMGRWAGTPFEPRLRTAAESWNDDLDNPDGVLPYEHDDYLAAWAQRDPVLSADYVALDEAQDADPAIARVFAATSLPRIVVGDPYQAIYGWRGAVNAMETMDGDDQALTGTFRFGQNLADVGNSVLTAMGSPLLMRGMSSDAGTVSASGSLEDASMVIARTNAGCVGALMEAQEAGVRAYISSGARDIAVLVEGAIELKRGGHPRPPVFWGISSWSDALDFVEEEPDPGDLGMLVSLDRRYGLSNVSRALSNASSTGMEITTAHRSKGRQSPHVVMWEDFKEIEDVAGSGRDAGMLLYVALTRASSTLDLGRLGGVGGLARIIAGPSDAERAERAERRDARRRDRDRVRVQSPTPNARGNLTRPPRGAIVAKVPDLSTMIAQNEEVAAL